MSERRTAVRMLQAQCLEEYSSGGEPVPRVCSTQPPTLCARASRRRSACFLLPPAEIIESYREGISLSCSGSVNGSTAPASPVLLQPRRAQPHPDCVETSPDAGSSPSPPGAGSTVGASDPDLAPFHLSVPLTLLSLHNGGMRHSPRASRDALPVSCFLISREGSIVCHPGDVEGIDELSPVDTPDSAAGASLSGGCKRPSERSSVCDSPLARTSSLILRSAPFPTATCSAAAGPSPPIPSRASTTGVMMTTSRASIDLADLPSPTEGLSPSISAGGKSPPLAEGGGAGGAACSGSIALPGHLCSHRPPTPVCKEDDLVASMRHMSSPTRRRSRFASTADSPLFAATAAAMAVEEADLLDSPRGVGGSSGAVNGGPGNWSCNGIVSEQRNTRRGTLGAISDSSGNGSGSVGVAGVDAAGAPAAAGGPAPRPALAATAAAAAAAAAGPPGEHVLRSPSLSMTWRTASQLVPVPEEPLRPQSRLEGLVVQRDAAAPTPTGLGPQSGGGSGGGSPSFVTAGSFPRAATPGPGAGPVNGGAAGVGRRLRNNSSSCMMDSTPEMSYAAFVWVDPVLVAVAARSPGPPTLVPEPGRNSPTTLSAASCTASGLGPPRLSAAVRWPRLLWKAEHRLDWAWD
ncbi:hypothetical protein Vafri_21521 [Volvox africanus]|uniref:Uncharacterized protein n=1 Tax=Volvox africanus TaxID=51714 RepID=A0A8J4FF04_9CHLO|nr:hypothetical protein Vafri_21521 [Volvox africanus]